MVSSLRALKSWNVPPSHVRLYLGTPTCFVIKTTRAMLINPYPYVSVSYESPCLLVESSESASGVAGYFFEEFNDRHLRAWDTELAVPVRDYDGTIAYLEQQLQSYNTAVTQILEQGKIIA